MLLCFAEVIEVLSMRLSQLASKQQRVLCRQPCIGWVPGGSSAPAGPELDRNTCLGHWLVFSSYIGTANYQAKPSPHDPQHQNHRARDVLCCAACSLLTSYICTTMPRFFAGAISAR